MAPFHGGEAGVCCCTTDGRPVCTRRGCFAFWIVVSGVSMFIAVVLGIVGSEADWIAIERHGDYPTRASAPSSFTLNYTAKEYHNLKTGQVTRLQICGCGSDSYFSCSRDYTYYSACNYYCTIKACTWGQPGWYTPLDLGNTFTGVNEQQIRSNVHGLVGFGTFCSFVALVLTGILGPCGGTKCFTRIRSSPRGVTLAYMAMLIGSIISAGMTAGSASRYQNRLVDIVSATMTAQNVGGWDAGVNNVVETTFDVAGAGYWGAQVGDGYLLAAFAAVFICIAAACMLIAGCCGMGWACCVSQRRIEETRGVGLGLKRNPGASVMNSSPGPSAVSGDGDGAVIVDGPRSAQQNPMTMAATAAANGYPQVAPGQYPAGGAYPMMMMMPGPYGPGGYPMMPVNPGQPPPGAIPVPGQPGAYMVPMPYPGYPGAPVPPGQQPGPGGYASAYPQQPMPMHMMGAGKYPWPGQQPGPSPGQWAGWQQQPQPQQQDPDVPSKGNTTARRTAFPTTATSGTGAAPAVSAAAPAPAAGTAAQAQAQAGRGMAGASGGRAGLYPALQQPQLQSHVSDADPG